MTIVTQTAGRLSAAVADLGLVQFVNFHGHRTELPVPVNCKWCAGPCALLSWHRGPWQSVFSAECSSRHSDSDSESTPADTGTAAGGLPLALLYCTVSINSVIGTLSLAGTTSSYSTESPQSGTAGLSAATVTTVVRRWRAKVRSESHWLPVN